MHHRYNYIVRTFVGAWLVVLAAVGCEGSVPGTDRPSPAPAPGPSLDASAPEVDVATPRPGLASSRPRDGSTIYARRMFDLTGARAEHHVELTLSAAFPEPTTIEVALSGGDDARRLRLACDGAVCVAPVPEVEGRDPQGLLRTSAFRYSTRYTATVHGLSAPTPSLAFETLPFDEELEHTCMHTIDTNVITLGLAEAPESAAVVTLTHRRHKLAFPVGSRVGFATLRVPGDGPYPYAVYLSRSLGVEVRRTRDGTRMAETSSVVPAACDRLAAVTRVTLYGGESYEVRVADEPAAPAPFELYLERKSRGASTDGGVCRSSGPCTSDAECCDYCHDRDHCH